MFRDPYRITVALPAFAWATHRELGPSRLIVRLIYIWQIRDSPFFDVLMGDARRYDAWATQIASGDVMGREVFYQAPLYPYFLGTIYAIAGHSLLIVRVCQALLGTASCVFLALTARRL